MENKIQIFSNPNFGEIRVTGTSDKPMFCLTDVCKALDIKNVSDCKSRLNQHGVGITDTIDALGREQPTTFINEGNLYKCIFQSRKAEANQFQDWVTDEVLPSVRKTGSYSISVPKSFAEALRLAADQQEQIERQEKLLAEQQPKVDYFDGLVDRNLLTNFRTTAKQLNIPQKKFISLLLTDGYLYRDKKGQLHPYSQYNNTLFLVKDCKGESWAGQQTLITPRGKETFRLLFSNNH